jgi:hypothetical protein
LSHGIAERHTLRLHVHAQQAGPADQPDDDIQQKQNDFKQHVTQFRKQ